MVHTCFTCIIWTFIWTWPLAGCVSPLLWTYRGKRGINYLILIKSMIYLDKYWSQYNITSLSSIQCCLQVEYIQLLTGFRWLVTSVIPMYSSMEVDLLYVYSIFLYRFYKCHSLDLIFIHFHLLQTYKEKSRLRKHISASRCDNFHWIVI